MQEIKKADIRAKMKMFPGVKFMAENESEAILKTDSSIKLVVKHICQKIYSVVQYSIMPEDHFSSKMSCYCTLFLLYIIVE